jgi:hypothetical protein
MGNGTSVKIKKCSIVTLDNIFTDSAEINKYMFYMLNYILLLAICTYYVKCIPLKKA